MVKSQIQINDIQQEINLKVATSLEIANKEMGIVQTDISWIKNKLDDFEKRWDKLDNRIWGIISVSVLGTLLSIAINLYFK